MDYEYFLTPSLQVLRPTMESFEGAVMVADISGFTRLTEQLSRGSQAAYGIELLTKCMNNYFTKVAIASCTQYNAHCD
jgi:class 3 adenylate cyclase